jgi:hypothetical protein
MLPALHWLIAPGETGTTKPTAQRSSNGGAGEFSLLPHKAPRVLFHREFAIRLRIRGLRRIL